MSGRGEQRTYLLAAKKMPNNKNKTNGNLKTKKTCILFASQGFGEGQRQTNPEVHHSSQKSDVKHFPSYFI